MAAPTHDPPGPPVGSVHDDLERIKQELSIEAMAHLTCVGATKDEIGTIVDELARDGIENVLCLRGDPPKGDTAFRAVEGGFAHANELVEFVAARTNGSFPLSHANSALGDRSFAYLVIG